MIRALEEKDVDIVMDIWLKTNIKAHYFIGEKYFRDNFETVKNLYIPMSITYLYEENNIVKGFISIIDDNFIGALFVDENYQGNGIGKKLLEYIENKNEILSLAVYKDNINSVNFYKNRGFKIVKEQVSDDSGHLEYIMKNK